MGARLSKSNCLPLQCLKTEKQNKNNNMKRKPQAPSEKEIGELKNLTLEDWLVASPLPGFKADQSLNGGELCVFKQLSKSVHLTSSGVCVDIKLTSENGFFGDVSPDSECYSVEISSTGGYRRSSLRRNKSEEVKKSVRFREPEEFDVFVIHSPAVTFAAGDPVAT